jgi:hypothetical protein
MFGLRRKNHVGLRREGWLARQRRFAGARKPVAKQTPSEEGSSYPTFTKFTWRDVAAVARVKQAIAAIRSWAYGSMGETRGTAHRLVAKLDTAVRHRDAVRAEHGVAVEQHDTFRGRLKDQEAEGELHRVPSLWSRGVFACCVVFASLTLATPVQALGVGVDLGASHADLGRQIGNGLAWVAALAFGWITASLGKTLGATAVNWSARDLVKDARVAWSYFWLIPAGGLVALLGSLYAAAIVREGQLELVALDSPIPAWSFAMFTAAIECAAIVLGWATATPVADAERRLAAAQEKAEVEAQRGGAAVDTLVGEIAALIDEHDALVLIAEELERGQFASAAEEIAVRAGANPAFYGLYDEVDVAARVFDANPAEPLAVTPILPDRTQADDNAGPDGVYELLRQHVEQLATDLKPEADRVAIDPDEAEASRNGRQSQSPAAR